ncbi:virion structural protein [Lactococcus phage LW31]|uniref:Structural protein n=4 Tax=Teubervirus LW31 TaxID=2845420 RepID=A0A1W6JI29_9CAUD|nr:virion structural protein [Lactococcus phage LW31]ARM65686.1 structural protein [Lactococcus phage LW31]ARM65773.1 structural protein [Lactococcus phage LW32]ARM65859.1 structural protein [Lactococcus phage LW33]
MTILRYNNHNVILAPDLTLELQNERKLRQLADIEVVEQTSNLVTIVNTRIDTLVKRMNAFESGAGTEWAVPLQKEKDERIAGDSDTRNLANALNTAMTNRVNGLFNDIVAVEDRVTVLEQDDTTIVRQGDTATFERLKVNRDIVGQTGSFSNQVTVGSLNNLSDHPWTKIQDEGDNNGTWVKRQGDIVYVRVKLDNSGASTAERWLCTLPEWAQLPGSTELMFNVPAWTIDATKTSNVQIHANKADDPNKNRIAILRNIANQKYSFEISYAVGDMPS